VWYWAASFVASGYPRRDEGSYLSLARPGRQISRYALRGNRSAFLFVFVQGAPLEIDPHDAAAQKRVLRERFAGGRLGVFDRVRGPPLPLSVGRCADHELQRVVLRGRCELRDDEEIARQATQRRVEAHHLRSAHRSVEKSDLTPAERRQVAARLRSQGS
jgi:hypothetical protein